MGQAVDRNTRERNRLRIKRKDTAYLAQQRANRAAQMAEHRRAHCRGENGQCWDCSEQAARPHIYCDKCLDRERARKSK